MALKKHRGSNKSSPSAKKQIDTCNSCGTETVIHVKNRKLCAKCYRIAYKSGEIPPLGSPRKRIIERYGEELLDYFDRAAKDATITLPYIAARYNVSRQRIHQLFNILYPISFKEHTKNARLSAKRLPPKYPPPGWIPAKPSVQASMNARKLFVAECTKRGLKIEYPRRKRDYHAKVNNYKVSIRAGTSPESVGKQKYYRIPLTTNVINRVDILAVRHPGLKEFFLIPKNKLPKAAVYLPVEGTATGNKYWSMRNNWDIFNK